MSRILITGCSSGFGLATAQHFHAQGWDVVATMRTPQAGLLPEAESLRVLPLDVTDPDSIASVVAAAGPIDALVNNAGVGMLNVLEGSDMDKVRELFETNLFGTFAMIKAFMPQFRERRDGVIVNVSSSVTLKPLPALSVYSASKAAMNAFTDSFAHEAALFGVRARTVLPGAAPSTPFAANVLARMGLDVPPAYGDFVQECLARLRSTTEVTEAEDVARAVWRAVTDVDAPARIPAGADAEGWFREASRVAA